MIGLFRGNLPPERPVLEGLRRKMEARSTIRDYTSRSGVVLRGAISALSTGSPFESFLPNAIRLVEFTGTFAQASVVTSTFPSLGREVVRLAERSGGASLPFVSGNGEKWGAVLIPAEQTRSFSANLIAFVRDAPLQEELKALIPEEGRLGALESSDIKAMADRRGSVTSEDLPGSVWLAVVAHRGPPRVGASLYLQATLDAHMRQEVYANWIDEREARRLYESQSEATLVEAARKAALRDTKVAPPSHECLPEVCSLLVPPSRQLLIDDETDSLAWHVLMAPVGLAPPRARKEVDWVRTLESPEAAAILLRLDDLNRIPYEAFIDHAAEVLETLGGAGAPGEYAVELRGGLRDQIRKFFAQAAKKREQTTLVACNDWLGDKPE